MQEKQNENKTTGKEDIKSPFLADWIIIYTENPKKSTDTLLELISELSKFAE